MPESDQPTTDSQATRTAEGENAKTASRTFGILGLFVGGIVFGPIALVQARKASRFGVRAMAGWILGWIDTALGVTGLVVILIRFT